MELKISRIEDCRVDGLFLKYPKLLMLKQEKKETFKFAKFPTCLDCFGCKKKKQLLSILSENEPPECRFF